MSGTKRIVVKTARYIALLSQIYFVFININALELSHTAI